MIKWKQSKKVLQNNNFVTKIMAGRVCDKCGKEDETTWRTIQQSRERRKEETDYCYECSQKGRKMPTGVANGSWKHGMTYNGYVRIVKNGQRMLEHVSVMEDHLNRKINKGEIIHHIDMNKLNNSISNLHLFNSRGEHLSCHNTMEQCGYLLLNKLIWFDRYAKQYTLIRAKPTIVDTFQLPYYKLHVDAHGYLAYSYKNSLGQWKYRRYHILVAETMLGRSLLRAEQVHHIDGNKINNNPSNLCVMLSSDHTICHAALQKLIATLYMENKVIFNNGAYQLK